MRDSGRYTPARRERSFAARRRSKRQLHSFVGCTKAQALIEAVRIRARLVGGELHHAASALAALADGPLHQHGTQPRASLPLRDAHGLHQSAPRTPVGQSRQKRKLKRAHHLAAAFHHRQQLVGIRVDGVERGRVARVQRDGRIFARAAQRIIRQHGDDGREIGRRRAADDGFGHGGVRRCEGAKVRKCESAIVRKCGQVDGWNGSLVTCAMDRIRRSGGGGHCRASAESTSAPTRPAPSARPAARERMNPPLEQSESPDTRCCRARVRCCRCLIIRDVCRGPTPR